MQSFKYSVLFILVVFLGSCSGEKNSFKIKGEISGLEKQKVYLEALGINSIDVVDSTESDGKGHFVLNGSTDEPGLYRLRMPNDLYILLALEHGNVAVTGEANNIENYKVEGSAASSSLKEFLGNVRMYMNDFNTLYVVMDSMKARGNDSMLAVANSELETKNASFTEYIHQYADSVKYLPNALFAVQMLNPQAQKTYIENFAANLNTRFPNSTTAKDFTLRINEMFAAINTPNANQVAGLSIGSAAPEIELATPNGATKKLSSLKGKFVLVDFWASWCGPCRAENPNVVAAYEKMKGKNFEILGVSLDNDKSKWIAAIDADELNWMHVSDLKGWESIAARNYNIQSIPANFLLDPEGKIIAKDLRGEDLSRTLEQLVK